MIVSSIMFGDVRNDRPEDDMTVKGINFINFHFQAFFGANPSSIRTIKKAHNGERNNLSGEEESQTEYLPGFSF